MKDKIFAPMDDARPCYLKSSWRNTICRRQQLREGKNNGIPTPLSTTPPRKTDPFLLTFVLTFFSQHPWRGNSLPPPHSPQIPLFLWPWARNSKQ